MSFETISLQVSGPIGRPLEYFPTLPSTNDYLLQLDSPLSGQLVVTDLQTAGRGRGTHRWEAAAGENLLFSFVLEIDTLDPVFSLMPIVTSVAICEAVDPQRKLSVGTKWPNDVVSGEKKLCGILIESRVRGATARVVVGIGLNVNQTHFTHGMTAMPTSLALLAKRALDREMVLGAIIDRLNHHIANLDSEHLIQTYTARCATIGREVSFEQDGRMKHGRAVAIDPRGRLLIDEGGSIRAYAGSEVSHVRPLS